MQPKIFMVLACVYLQSLFEVINLFNVYEIPWGKNISNIHLPQLTLEFIVVLYFEVISFEDFISLFLCYDVW